MSSLRDKRSARTKQVAVPHPSAATARPAEVEIGRIVGVACGGVPIVDFPANPAGRPVTALATAGYGGVPCGATVALMFVSGDRTQPLAIGLIAQPDAADAAEACEPAQKAPAPVERMRLVAEQEIVLQCGRASIVLTRAGKVLLRGAYVSSRASGLQRIMGASVQIN
jgi:hypothetical protein